MNVETVRNDLIVAVGKQYESNSTVFLDGDRALLVDGMASREDALELRRLVETSLGRKAHLLVSTHYFSDHLAAWKAFPGVPVVAHRNYRHTFDSEKFRSAEETEFFVEPTVLVGDGLEIRWGRHTLDVFYNPGHTLGTLAIDVPEADLLFVGDTVVGNIVYLNYGTPTLVAQALRRLQSRRRSTILASHQGVSSANRLDHALQYLEKLEAQVARIPSEGIREIELASCLPDGVPGTEFERAFHRRNLDTLVARTGRG